MIGILIVSHGNLSKAFLDTVEMIMGKQENAFALSLDYGVDDRAFRALIAEQLDILDRGDGIIAFADLFGGTPSNSLIACMKERRFAAFAGVNLPMLIECASAREYLDFPDLIERLNVVGKQGIIDIEKKMAKKGDDNGRHEV
jgi:PTS system mannose-specific IIA component